VLDITSTRKLHNLCPTHPVSHEDESTLHRKLLDCYFVDCAFVKTSLHS
jgi:hypothetical protein